MTKTSSRLPDRTYSDLLMSIAQFDSNLRDTTEWSDWEDNKAHKYAILHNDKLYPVKKIVSLATGVSVSEFSGGNEANGYVAKRGLRVTALRAYSWHIESATRAYKVLDKSAFLHFGTGIPSEIRPFFIADSMAQGEKRPITLIYDDVQYSAQIVMDKEPNPRAQLLWKSDFASTLKSIFPHHYSLYSRDLRPESEIILRFETISNFDTYKVTFAGDIKVETAQEDISAEELEDRGPQKEGSIKEYYGKRYERNPVNRQRAIQLHGLTCNVCGFNFEAVYGERGADFIEVHHIKPISTFEEEHHVDPKEELITVCSNCHRMIHRKSDEILTIQQIKELVTNMRGQ